MQVEETAKSCVLDVYDDDVFGGNDFLGRIRLPMENIVNGQVMQRWYPLSSQNDDVTEESEELVVEGKKLEVT